MKTLKAGLPILFSLFFFVFLFSCEVEDDVSPDNNTETLTAATSNNLSSSARVAKDSTSRKDSTRKKVDCPKLGLNYKDTCKTRDGRIGLVWRGCICDPFRKAEAKDSTRTTKYDCERLKLDIGDACKTTAGERGKVDRACKCTVPPIKYDCERIKKNIGDSCTTARGATGKIDRSCNCS